MKKISEDLSNILSEFSDKLENTILKASLKNDLTDKDTQNLSESFRNLKVARLYLIDKGILKENKINEN